MIVKGWLLPVAEVCFVLGSWYISPQLLYKSAAYAASAPCLPSAVKECVWLGKLLTVKVTFAVPPVDPDK